ncbi:MAG TPA: DUF6755 family protein [Chthonomonadaceae bacterium]|nr:DUF6755 family protein [Chthonomonadaceae bacterium]
MIAKDPRKARLEQRSQAVLTLMAIVLVILLLQLWLITIALEDCLAAHTALAVPTFAASAICFLINLWLLKYLYDIDRTAE